MRRNTRQFLHIAGFPLALLTAYLVLYAAWTVFDLPSRPEIVEAARGYYEIHGYWVVFVGALIEGALLVNWYFPGSVIILLGVILAVESKELNVTAVVGLATAGFFIAGIANYALGRFGWYRLLLRFGLHTPMENAKQKLERHGLPIIFTTYIHPNLGALTATSAGVLGIPFRRFLVYSAGALVIWNSFWGLIAFLFGPTALEILNSGPLILGVLLVWIVLLFIRHWWRVRNVITGIP